MKLLPGKGSSQIYGLLTLWGSFLSLAPHSGCHTPFGDSEVSHEWLPASQFALLNSLKLPLRQLLHEKGQHPPLPSTIHHQQAMAKLCKDVQEVQVWWWLGVIDLTRDTMARHGKHNPFPVQ